MCEESYQFQYARCSSDARLTQRVHPRIIRRQDQQADQSTKQQGEVRDGEFEGARHAGLG
jgi:hypothetical protein